MVFILLSLKREGAAFKEVQDEMTKTKTRLLDVHDTGLEAFFFNGPLYEPLLSLKIQKRPMLGYMLIASRSSPLYTLLRADVL